MNKVCILPTGEEILTGIVRDTDSPMIVAEILQRYPETEIERKKPLHDIQEDITESIIKSTDADLIILIGGSGEGSKYSEILGHDFTHKSMENALDKYVATALYGKNGHMWSKLICGTISNTIIINLPGPYIEAKAALEAFLRKYKNEQAKDMTEETLKMINAEMANAVKQQYVFNK